MYEIVVNRPGIFHLVVDKCVGDVKSNLASTYKNIKSNVFDINRFNKSINIANR